jgi:hypothetical protein
VTRKVSGTKVYDGFNREMGDELGSTMIVRQHKTHDDDEQRTVSNEGNMSNKRKETL